MFHSVRMTRNEYRLDNEPSPSPSPQFRMIQVRVNPLENQPVPLPIDSNVAETATTEEEEDYQRFTCEICYEFLNEPVGCGSCSSRFCRSCLQRVYDSDMRKQQQARCPVCRNEYDQMIFDVGIYGGNDDIPTLPCRYACVGCKETKIPLPEIANHEAKCEHVQMRCRYARYGCNWTGKRGLIKAHEQFGCKVAPMGPFVEQYRQTAMRLEMTTQQLAANSRFLHLLRSSYARDNQRKSLMDIFRLIQYCYTVTTLTPHFFITKEAWVSYWRNNEIRAAVINFCSYAPVLAACFGVTRRSMSSFFDFVDVLSSEKNLTNLVGMFEFENIANESPNVTTVMSTMIDTFRNFREEKLVVDIFLGFCVFVLGLLLIFLSFVDVKSNMRWDMISIPRLGKFPIVGDVLGISIFTILLAIMEYYEAGFRADIVWTVVLVTSTFFPAVIFSISHFTARLVTGTPAPATFDMMYLARSVEPCMFGLRYSMLISWFGVISTVDASIVLCLVPRKFRISMRNSFYDHLPRSVCIGLLGIKVASWGYQLQYLLHSGNRSEETINNDIESSNQLFSSFSDTVSLAVLINSIFSSFIATLSLMITNCIIHTLFSFGIEIGKYIAQNSQKELDPHNITRGTAKEYSFFGLVIFGCWMLSFALLL